MNEFNNRVFGCVIVKAINSNYNADFTHQPRTLPDGTVYATDKAFKYSIRNYLKDSFSGEKIFYFKQLNENLNPLTLDETYEKFFGQYPKTKVLKKKKGASTESEEESLNKKAILANLLSCLDIRLFGATFAGETNISIHGPVQINHGINRYPLNEIYSEQIMSPFRNPGKEGSDEKEMTTLGQQSKLREGHYVHHFSVNPKNLEDMKNLVQNAAGLTTGDIEKLKEAMRLGITYYDSASKAGTDNELLLWVQLKQDSKTVLPVFTELVQIARTDAKIVIDLAGVGNVLTKVQDDIETLEVYYNSESTKVMNLPLTTTHKDITTAQEIQNV